MQQATPSRRRFLQRLAAGAGTTLAAPGLLMGCATRNGTAVPIAEGWDRVPQILARIQALTFPDRDFLITDYGAQSEDATEAITDPSIVS